jgi:hypothetical protein
VVFIHRPQCGNRLASFGGDRIDGDSVEAMSSPRCAGLNGFNMHANVSIGACDRARLERLLRYAARPPVCLERLARLTDGRVAYRLKRIWSDGTTDIIFEPLDFIGKPSIVPAPGTNSDSLTSFVVYSVPAETVNGQFAIAPRVGGERSLPSCSAVVFACENRSTRMAWNGLGGVAANGGAARASTMSTRA